MQTERLKFRAKATDGSWLYGIPFRTTLGNWMMHDKQGAGRYIDPDTIGQLVAVLNGKEVYEGDLIYVEIPASDVADVPLGSGVYYKNILEVQYYEESASYYPFDEFKGYCEEVVGNIHDREIQYEGKRYKAVFEGNERPANGCEDCALKDIRACWGGREFCDAFQDEDHSYWHFELITSNDKEQ